MEFLFVLESAQDPAFGPLQHLCSTLASNSSPLMSSSSSIEGKAKESNRGTTAASIGSSGGGEDCGRSIKGTSTHGTSAARVVSQSQPSAKLSNGDNSTTDGNGHCRAGGTASERDADNGARKCGSSKDGRQDDVGEEAYDAAATGGRGRCNSGAAAAAGSGARRDVRVVIAGLSSYCSQKLHK